MTLCNLCSSHEIVKVTVKKTGKILAVCKECGSVYETTDDGNPAYDHDPRDVEYFNNLLNAFDTWNDVENVVPYNQ